MTVLERELTALPVGAGHVLDCLAPDPETPGGDAWRVFCAPGMAPLAIAGADAARVSERRTLGGAEVVTLSAGDVPALVDGALRPVAPETALFAGRNCLLGERNGETVEAVRDWLLWHGRVHGATGAVILDRAPPEEARDFAGALRAMLAEAGTADLLVVLLRASVPLGKPGLGPEAHPLNAPDAPGKDRMVPPAPDPWRSALGLQSFHELARWRFLARARAVAALDVSDLVPAMPGALGGLKGAPTLPAEATLFDQAVAAPQGAVLLLGQRAYPWGLRKGARAGFGDHVCVRFDDTSRHRRWCIAPAVAPAESVWRMIRVVGPALPLIYVGFFRCMALRYGEDGAAAKVSRLVPKSSLVEAPALLAIARETGAAPLRMPAVEPAPPGARSDRVVVVTTMKNEGPFILEWLAYHRAIGVDDVLVYTNDCTDGTDAMLDLLQEKGLLQHRENPFRGTGLKPQHAAFAAAEKEPLVREAGWIVCMDVDEFINIHAGDGRLEDLFAAVPEANMISMTWRLFGNADVAGFRDDFVTRQFTRCAPQMTRKPHQAWGFKTIFRNLGIFKKLGVHRPKGLRPQRVDRIDWVNGSGRPMPETEWRNAWRSTSETVGYDLVTLNHYAVRSAESFLVKRDRGRVNHVDRDQGLAYWFRMNNNAEEDRSIQARLPMAEAEFARLVADPEIRAAHDLCVARHRARIEELKAREDYAALYAELTGPRLRKLSRLHRHFGAGVFLAGPQVIPDTVLGETLPDDFFFTVPKPQTST